MSITTIFLLLGGLGLFLFGMTMMSDGLERVAGARMRSILEFFTKNRFVGMLVGILFTAVVQSSSATTVMVVSFVNSGLMNLYQAAGVILGANIGTTVTGQLIAFNLSDIAPLFVIIGVVMFMFSKKQNVKKIGGVSLGFGILFMGLSTMSEGISSQGESAEITDESFGGDAGRIRDNGSAAELLCDGRYRDSDGFTGTLEFPNLLLLDFGM